ADRHGRLESGEGERRGSCDTNANSRVRQATTSLTCTDHTTALSAGNAAYRQDANPLRDRLPEARNLSADEFLFKSSCE
ncbi:hypothetical protein JWH11_01515, partial [Xanthomonas melonis]